MKNLKKKFVVRDNEGNVKELFIENGSIYYKNFEPTFTVEKITDNTCDDFYAVIDCHNTIHILFQDTSGNIMYINNSNNSWGKCTVLTNNKPEPYNKHFYILPLEKNIHLFFIINDNDNNLIINQTITDKKISEPLVIDYISCLNFVPFNIDKDSKNNLYIFYNHIKDNYVKIGYKKFNNTLLKWSDYVEIGNSTINNSPFVLIDNDDNIHTVWYDQKSETTVVFYRKKTYNKWYDSSWDKEIIVYSGFLKLSDTFLVIIDNTLWSVLYTNGLIYTCYYDEYRLTWSKVIKYDTSLLNSIYIINYSTNFIYEKKRLTVKRLLGCTKDYLKLILVNDFIDTTQNHLEEIAVTADGIQVYQNNVDNIELYIESAKNYFNKAVQKAFSIEKQKNDLEKDFMNLKKLNSKLQEESSCLKNSLNTFDFENKKLSIEIQNQDKKISNITNLLNQKEQTIINNCHQIVQLKEMNINLDNEIVLLRHQLYKEKNMPFFKKLFKFKVK